MKSFLCGLILLVASMNTHAQQSLYPQPYGVLPTNNQLAWHELEQYAMVTLVPTTYLDQEWGYGDADPKIFNPTNFDANQIIQAIKAGGFKGVLIVAKHHDGFCLWPTKSTDYNISKSPFRDGKGDMIREYETAARKAGLKFGLYCSPWDRNNPNYGSLKYLDVYQTQLTELLTNYGDLFITWFDGANGGDGYYGGAKEMRKIDITTYYNWPEIWGMVKKLQPKTVIFGDVGDVRWVGNEQGFAAETSWSTYSPKGRDGVSEAVPGNINFVESQEGTRNGHLWMPAECDVPLRPGWMYHKSQNNAVKTPLRLFDLYCKSVGRGANLDVGLSPNMEGRLDETDVKSLKGFGEILQKTFSKDFAKSAKISATNIRNRDLKTFNLKNLTDNDRYSYWATDDSVTKASITLEWKIPIEFNVFRLKENIKLGQRIEKVSLESFENGSWKTIAQATSIGSNRLIRLKNYHTTKKIRLTVLESPVSPAISEIGVFAEPKQITIPEISRDKSGMVTIKTESPIEAIRFTTNGTEPTAASKLYTQPFDFQNSGIIKAKSFIGNKASETGSKTLGLSKKNWTIIDKSFENAFEGGAANNAIDEDENTMWHTYVDGKSNKIPPQFLAINLGAELEIAAFTYTPRKRGTWGIVNNYQYQISQDGKNWQTVAEGEFSNIKANPVEQVIMLKTPQKARFIKFIGLSAVEDNYISASEIGIILTK